MQSEEISGYVSGAINGNLDSFSVLVEEYNKPVIHLCYRMLGDMNEAEDAAQETFLRAYKAIRNYDTSRSFITWLLSIASHYCIDQLRRKRPYMISIDNDNQDYGYEIEIPDNMPGPEAIVHMNENNKQIQSMLKTLDPTDRAAIILLYWHEYSYEKIADVLSISVSALKSRLHRARKQLAQVWMKENNKQTKTTKSRQARKQYELPVF